MITWDPRTNCITSWLVPQWPKPLRLTGWGCEVGNWFGFFAHEQLGGIACDIKNFQLGPANCNELASSWRIHLPKGIFEINTLDKMIWPNSMVRILSILNPSQSISWVGDFVLRIVIPWEDGLVGEIEGQQIIHHGTNFYHDTEDDQVGLRWADGRVLTISWLKRPDRWPAFSTYLYLRDQPPLLCSSHKEFHRPVWVIHARLLVDYPAALVFRFWRNPFVLWSRGLLGRYLISTDRLKNLWRAGEWKTNKRRALYGLWPLMPEQSINFAVKIDASGG
jgi:hypothetical protein